MKIIHTILFLTVISCSGFHDKEKVEAVDPIEFLSSVLTDTVNLNLISGRYNSISDISILPPPNFSSTNFKDHIISILEETDTLFIIDQLRQSSNFRTNKLEEYGYRIIKVSEMRDRGIDCFETIDNVEPGILSVTRPIFNRNYTLAYLRFGVICGPLCGSGSEVILEKKAGKWIVKEILGTWIS